MSCSKTTTQVELITTKCLLNPLQKLLGIFSDSASYSPLHTPKVCFSIKYIKSRSNNFQSPCKLPPVQWGTRKGESIFCISSAFLRPPGAYEPWLIWDSKKRSTSNTLNLVDFRKHPRLFYFFTACIPFLQPWGATVTNQLSQKKCKLTRQLLLSMFSLP